MCAFCPLRVSVALAMAGWAIRGDSPSSVGFWRDKCGDGVMITEAGPSPRFRRQDGGASSPGDPLRPEHPCKRVPVLRDRHAGASVAVHLVPRSGPHGLGEDRVSSSVGSGVTNAVV